MSKLEEMYQQSKQELSLFDRYRLKALANLLSDSELKMLYYEAYKRDGKGGDDVKREEAGPLGYPVFGPDGMFVYRAAGPDNDYHRGEDLPKTALAAEIINNQKSAGAQEAVKELYGLDDLGGNPFAQTVVGRMEQVRRLEEMKYRRYEAEVNKEIAKERKRGRYEPFIKMNIVKDVLCREYGSNRKLLLLEGV